MKRSLFKLALFLLLLGAIVNVAVAWGCVLWIDRPQQNSNAIFLKSTDGDWFVSIRNAFGTTQIHSGRKKWSWSEFSSPLPDEQVIPKWAYILKTPTEGYENGIYGTWESRQVDGRGWPMLTVWSETSRCVGRGSTIPCEQNLEGIPIPKPLWPNISIRKFPNNPIWRGFIINTIFYATLIWLLTLGPFTARRMIRRKCNHCIKCGYDLRGAEHEVCPECGNDLTAKAKP